MSRMKFHNSKIWVMPDGMTYSDRRRAEAHCRKSGIAEGAVECFDSRAELSRWRELRLLERSGAISGLKRQVEFQLLPKQTVAEKERDVKEKRYITPDGNFFSSMEKAKRYCKSSRLPLQGITSHVFTRAVVRERVLEKSAMYTADFVYQDNASGELVVEDVKSAATRRERDYVLRRKLMLYFHGIRVKEVIER